MKRLVLLGIIAAVLLSIPSMAFAAGYGAAGCGLGSMAFGTEPGAEQVFAATTNGTSGSQTFGITSGTSNCGDHGMLNLAKEREIFAEQNYASLVKEMAVGKGENLSTLASLYGCAPKTHPAFGALVQKKFDSLVSSEETTSDQMLIMLEGQLVDHPSLSKSCNAI